MKNLQSILNWLSSLKVAICLLILIAIASGIGTAIPQNGTPETYIENYGKSPWLGFIKGQLLLGFQLDHVYTSLWFISLLTWLTIALVACSCRRQWPMLKSALKWTDYKSIKQIDKLAISQSVKVNEPIKSLDNLSNYLIRNGWNVNKKEGRIAARKGALGRVGPLLVHLGLILIISGATIGNIYGIKTETFLAPGRSLDLINNEGDKQLNISLNNFNIERDPAGRPEQFTSKIKLTEVGGNIISESVSVNHPLRFKGVTIYQADWALAGITLKLGESPKFQFPLDSFPQLGEQVWGIVIPTSKDGSNAVLLTVNNEKGPVNVFDESGMSITSINPEGRPKEVNGVPISILNIIPSSGLLIKKDPGVPFVYFGFFIILCGGFLSIISTNKLWVIIEEETFSLHLGGLSNRNLSGFANKLPSLIEIISQE